MVTKVDQVDSQIGNTFFQSGHPGEALGYSFDFSVQANKRSVVRLVQAISENNGSIFEHRFHAELNHSEMSRASCLANESNLCLMRTIYRQANLPLLGVRQFDFRFGEPTVGEGEWRKQGLSDLRVNALKNLKGDWIILREPMNKRCPNGALNENVALLVQFEQSFRKSKTLHHRGNVASIDRLAGIVKNHAHQPMGIDNRAFSERIL